VTFELTKMQFETSQYEWILPQRFTFAVSQEMILRWRWTSSTLHNKYSIDCCSDLKVRIYQILWIRNNWSSNGIYFLW